MENSLKFFTPKKDSFGCHETFAHCYSWLTKGFQAFNKNQAIFSLDESTLEIAILVMYLTLILLFRIKNGLRMF